MSCLEEGNGDEKALVACPVCDGNILLSSADEHVGICLLRMHKRSPAQKRKVAQLELSVLWERSLTPMTELTGHLEPRAPTSSSLPFRLPPLEPRATLGFTICGERWRQPSGKPLYACASGCPKISDSGVFTDSTRDTSTASTASTATRTHSSSLSIPHKPLELEKIVVPLRGREHRTHIAAVPKVGTTLAVVREVDNPADTRALRCMLCRTGDTTETDERCEIFVGYVPRQVSAHLSPLIDDGLLTISACVYVSDDVVGLAEIELRGKYSSFDHRADRILPAWKCAVEAAIDARDGHQEVIRRRLLSLLEHIQCPSSIHAHLLQEDEASAFERLRACSISGQALVIRLLQRKTTWSRIPSLDKYSEVSDPQAAVAELCSVGLACSGDQQECSNMDMTDRLEALSRGELVTLARKFNLNHRLCKDKLVMLLNAATGKVDEDRCKALFHAWLDTLGGQSNMIRLSRVLLQGVRVVLFLTFLRPFCDLSALVLQDVGTVRYPTPAIKFDSRVSQAVDENEGDNSERVSLFLSRKHLDAYLRASSEAASVDAALHAGDESTALKLLQVTLSQFLDPNTSADVTACSTFQRRFSHEWIRAKMASTGIALLERMGRHSEATQVLFGLLSACTCPEKRGAWYVRASTNLAQHLGRPYDAMNVCEAGLQDSWVRCGDRIGLQRRLLRLARRHKRWRVIGARWRVDVEWEAPVDLVPARTLNADAPEKNRYCTILDYGDATVSVETLALAYYAGDEGGNWRGVHSEFRIWATLFGLLFAEVMLTPIPGVFQSPCQTAPLDFATDSFAPSRYEAIADKLSRIRKGNGRNMIRAAWHDHYGSAIYGVSWALLTLEDLCDVVDGLGSAPLASIMGLMADDYSGWRGGAPDLILWHPSSVGAQVKAVEVKSSNDRLSDQQRAWILALRDAGVKVSLCKVV